MSKFLYYASLVVILHAVQFLFTGVAMWSPLQEDFLSLARGAGLFMFHAGAFIYAAAYGCGEIK